MSCVFMACVFMSCVFISCVFMSCVFVPSFSCPLFSYLTYSRPKFSHPTHSHPTYSLISQNTTGRLIVSKHRTGVFDTVYKITGNDIISWLCAEMGRGEWRRIKRGGIKDTKHIALPIIQINTCGLTWHGSGEELNEQENPKVFCHIAQKSSTQHKWNNLYTDFVKVHFSNSGLLKFKIAFGRCESLFWPKWRPSLLKACFNKSLRVNYSSIKLLFNKSILQQKFCWYKS